MRTPTGTWFIVLSLAACAGGTGDGRVSGAKADGDVVEDDTSSPSIPTTGISAGQTPPADSTSTSAAAESSSGALEDKPDLGSSVQPGIRVVVVSDMNDTYGSTTYDQTVHRAVTRVVELAPDVVLSTGDMVAGQLAGLDYAQMWTAFHAAVTDVFEQAGLPFAVTPGNHDGSGYPEFAQERDIFVQQWRARKPALEYLDDSHYPLRYSFAMGPALFVSLDATTIGPLDFGQMSWLEDQLEAGAEYPVKIVYGHLPVVPFAQGREGEIIGDPELEAMLEEHGVTLFISGHHHAYYPGRFGSVRHVSTSCLGAGPRPLLGQDDPSLRSVLVIDIDGAGTVTSLEAHAGQQYDAPIERETLPGSLSHGRWVVTRDDLRQ